MGLATFAQKGLCRITHKLFGDRLINLGGRGIVNLVDVGSVGPLPLPWCRFPHRIRHLLRFEPREEATESSNVTRLDCALWSRAEVRPFYIYRGFRGSGSSLLEQNTDYVRDNYQWLSRRGPSRLARTALERAELARTTSVECRTLDDVLTELPRSYEFLKIDAQGAELEILKGAEAFLRESCWGLHLELQVIPMMKGVPHLTEVVSYLRQRDYELVKVFPPHGTFDSQHDCVFLRAGISTTMRDVLASVYSI